MVCAQGGGSRLESGLRSVSRLRGEAGEGASDWERTKDRQWQDPTAHRWLWEPAPRMPALTCQPASRMSEGLKSDITDLKK